MLSEPFDMATPQSLMLPSSSIKLHHTLPSFRNSGTQAFLRPGMNVVMLPAALGLGF